jgi:hypothetical protein
MRTWLLITLAGTAMIAGACTDTFLVYKDGKGYFVGSNSKAMYEMLCASGDFEKVLAATRLSKEMKDTLYTYNCSAERSGDKVKQIYASMTPDQRKDIRNAFKENGYDINYLPCCGDQINDTSGRL